LRGRPYIGVELHPDAEHAPDTALVENLGTERGPSRIDGQIVDPDEIITGRGVKAGAFTGRILDLIHGVGDRPLRPDGAGLSAVRPHSQSGRVGMGNTLLGCPDQPLRRKP
jgi:hypothetical protein